MEDHGPHFCFPIISSTAEKKKKKKCPWISVVSVWEKSFVFVICVRDHTGDLIISCRLNRGEQLHQRHFLVGLPTGLPSWWAVMHTAQGFRIICGSAGKESSCNAEDLGLIPGWGRSPGEGKGYPFPVFWPGEFHGLYSPWGHKGSDTTEQLFVPPHPMKWRSLSENVKN